MKKSAGSILAAIAALVTTQELKATVLFSDNFDSYNNGNLVGQGGWTITGTSVVDPLQVNGGVLSVGATGQDAYSAFGSSVSTSAGGSLFIGLDLDVTAAGTGDYFLHLGSTLGGTSGFYDKVYVESSGSGYVLGSLGTSGTITYGTSVLSYGTSYHLVTEEDFVSGPLNDTFEFYVNPTDTSVAANNTPYLTAAWGGTVAEAGSYSEINIRQGTTGSASTETVDNLVVGTAFSDVSGVSAVPEPSTVGLAAVGGVACLFALRRRK